MTFIPYGCHVCCTVFSFIGVVLLVMFGFLFKMKNITLYVTSFTHSPPWDLDKKAMSCFVAAAIYAGVGILCSIPIWSNKLKKTKSFEEEEQPLVPPTAQK
eukprot:PhF_6_TR4201/c0_g1_i2/m.5651